MNSLEEYSRKHLIRKRLWIWITGIITVFLIILGLYKLPEIKNGLKNREVSEKAATENSKDKAFVRISPTPSKTTLDEIGEWVEKDLEEREKFKKYSYQVTQYYGIHIGMVDWVLSRIREIKDENDAQNVITSLEGFSGEFNNTVNSLEDNKKDGIIPPRFIITQVKDQIRELKVKDIKRNNIYLAYKQKLYDTNISDENKKKLLIGMERVIKNNIYPGYSALLKYFEKLEPYANNDAGVWKFDNGDKYYAYLLKHNTSTDMTPQEVYDLGLKEIDRIQAEIQLEFKALGYKGALKENMISLNNDERFLYPEDDAGRSQIINDYNKIIRDMYAITGEMFDIAPSTELKVIPVSEFTEESAPQAYYYPSLSGEDGTGIFYVNTSKPTYKFDMQSIAYHEAIPGHHMQMALQQELLSAEYPEKANFYIPAYIEGWGLYAESLADEYGMYTDSYSRLGYLRGELLRALRLVIDTGIHYKKWTREYAIEYMMSFGCIPDEYAAAEVDRYIVDPGQACSYKIGEIKIIQLREKAKSQLGEKFNIKDFHNVILRNGPMPIELMEKEVQRYINLVK